MSKARREAIAKAIEFLALRGFYDEHPDDPDDERIAAALAECWDRHDDALYGSDTTLLGSHLADLFQHDWTEHYYATLPRWACPCGTSYRVEPLGIRVDGAGLSHDKDPRFWTDDERAVKHCVTCGLHLADTRRDVSTGQLLLPMTEGTCA